MTKKHGHKSYAFAKPAALKKIDRLLAYLAEPHSVYEVAEYLPLARRTAVAYLAFLRGELPNSRGEMSARRVRIAGWRLRDSGHHEALYQVGGKPDASKPAGRSVMERRRDVRRRLQQTDPDELLRRRRTRQAKRRPARRDAMITAFFGAPA